MNRKEIFDYFLKLATPAAIAFFGYYTNNVLKEKDINIEMIKISVNILSEESSEKKIPIRKWAIDTIDKYSSIKFNDDQKSLLLYNAIIVTDLKPDTVLNDDSYLMDKPQFITDKEKQK